MHPDLQHALLQFSQRVDHQLKQFLPIAENIPVELHQAMSYSTFNGGKRIRPFLVYATAKALAIDLQKVDHCAAAIELIHCYSLVHDDMPCMDDDDLRRGQPTCHIKFSEATALLTGDALQTQAFNILTQNTEIKASSIVDQIKLLSLASGSLGMAGGQAIDLSSVGKKIDFQQLQIMHKAKTGALIQACVQMVCCLDYSPENSRYQSLNQYAQNIGLAFQIQDDILDIEGDTDVIGKPQGSDDDKEKPTYPSLLGLEQAKILAQEKYQKAIESLTDFDQQADLLRHLAKYIVERNK